MTLDQELLILENMKAIMQALADGPDSALLRAQTALTMMRISQIELHKQRKAETAARAVAQAPYPKQVGEWNDDTSFSAG